jgi:hypothetical protein
MILKTCVSTMVVLALVARATPAAANDKADAKAHIARATALHGEEKWSEALEELMAAYALDHRPELLYAIGQLHVKLGDCPLAIRFYQKFIASKPGKKAISAAKEAITVCKNNPPPAAAGSQVEPPAPEPEPAPAVEPAPEPVPAPEPAPVAEPEPARVAVAAPAAELAPDPSLVGGRHDEDPSPRARPWYSDVFADVLLGGGIVCGVGGVLMYRSAVSNLDAADDAPTYEDANNLRDDAHSKRMYAIGLGVGGVALTTVAVIRYLTHDRRPHDRMAIVPHATGATFVLTGSF